MAATKLNALGKVKVFGRLSFPALAKAESFKGDPNGKPRYGLSILVPKNSEDMKVINEVIKEVFEDKWGSQPAEKKKAIWNSIMSNKKTFVTDGDAKEYDGYQGHNVLSAYNPLPSPRPLCINQRREVIPADEIEQTLYSGCYVNVILNVWAQDNNYGKGIRASIGGVQFAKDGDRFSGASIAKADEFDEIEEVSSDDADFSTLA